MMKPYQVMFYVYAEDEEQVKALQSALHTEVMDMYEEGVLVTADALASAVRTFGRNPLLKSYLYGQSKKHI